ncbi:SDR family NAD(P)-dependent oxidoreductase [Enterobacter sp. Ap-1006]|uniref:SDR family NAD(P)-dependent oxidoreductase n=1 Tax=Enterobacter sp. Ap-1006 TaxID=2608345 RepID=UPI001420479E|nr:SDR family NAD(P)-dependent oxidoreductase [Enterobacter sp. Ap-1006]NIF47391.1 SDR family NAD(P)-dependent oxidoreductase [Enterobacter sp. Ap-1006]
MARIFITGSAGGLGKMAAQRLVAQGHQVVLHARNKTRVAEALKKTPGAEAAFAADLSSIAETKALAEAVNASGHFDAIIHNAAVGYQEKERLMTVDGLPQVFAVNTLAPYILTTLIQRPKRLVYLSSSLHAEGDATLQDLAWENRRWDGPQAYSDSKLHITLLTFAIARLWPEVRSNCVDPGWVPTRMGGVEATDALELGPDTQVWLAADPSLDKAPTGGYFYHQKASNAVKDASDSVLQQRLFAACAQYSGIEIA